MREDPFFNIATESTPKTWQIHRETLWRKIEKCTPESIHVHAHAHRSKQNTIQHTEFWTCDTLVWNLSIFYPKTVIDKLFFLLDVNLKRDSTILLILYLSFSWAGMTATLYMKLSTCLHPKLQQQICFSEHTVLCLVWPQQGSEPKIWTGTVTCGMPVWVARACGMNISA